ncbi:MAG: hypothetical protein ACRC41_09350 [Sarcina sp.]
MRSGIIENVTVNGIVSEIISYDVVGTSAFKLAGFFRELFDKLGSDYEKSITIKCDGKEIKNISSQEIYFIPETDFEHSAKGRGDYYGRMEFVVYDSNSIEHEVISVDDCYEKQTLDINPNIKAVKVITTNEIVIEIIL